MFTLVNHKLMFYLYRMLNTTPPPITFSSSKLWIKFNYQMKGENMSNLTENVPWIQISINSFKIKYLYISSICHPVRWKKYIFFEDENWVTKFSWSVRRLDEVGDVAYRWILHPLLINLRSDMILCFNRREILSEYSNEL